MDQAERDRAIRQAIRERLLRRSISDLDFRRMLIDHPKSALARELGIDIPDDMHVTVLPESENQMFIVIPPLSDESGTTGVEKLSSAGPAYGTAVTTGIERLAGTSGSTYGPGRSELRTGIERLAGSGGSSYGPGGAELRTGIERLAGSGPSTYGPG
jgi:hypothetical protein